MFFDPIKPPKDPPRPKRRARGRIVSADDRPEGVIAGSVALELVLAQSASAVVGVGQFGAYKSGFELVLVVVAFDEDLDLDFGMPNGFPPHRRRREQPEPNEIFRFGVEYADGSKAQDFSRRFFPPSDEKRPGPRISHRGGSSSDDEWRHRLWITPLPPKGPLKFAVEWPVAGIPETITELDATPLREAASSALELRRRRRRAS